ncbi:MAG TPA: cyclic nucleotide-binding domain-containing protein, partial [Holophaga sp.]|nr:cyclic nucleotide-binding domain-containing protein [Holophaga sp.]
MVVMKERAARRIWSLDDLLQQEPFRDLAIRDDLQRYCPSASIRTFKHTSVIFLQGDPCPEVACILDGQVTLVRVDLEGNQFTTDLLFDGDFLGAGDGGEIPESPVT